MQWQLSRASGSPGPSDAVLDGACVRAPAGSPVATYTLTATIGALTARGTAAVVSPEEFRSLIARHIEDDDTANTPAASNGAASGTGVGSAAPEPVEAPPAASPLRWIALALTLLTALVVLVLLVRRARKPVVPVVTEDPYAPAAVPRTRPVSLPRIAVDSVVPPVPSPPVAPVAPVAPRPVFSKRCPVCDKRYTSENAFCAEHGVALVDINADGPVPAVPAPPAAIAAAPVPGAPNAPTAVLPLVCPKCRRRYPAATTFCGEDGSTLVSA